jgi:hypothetical protein
MRNADFFRTNRILYCIGVKMSEWLKDVKMNEWLKDLNYSKLSEILYSN